MIQEVFICSKNFRPLALKNGGLLSQEETHEIVAKQLAEEETAGVYKELL
jgi:hypothetical protein